MTVSAQPRPNITIKGKPFVNQAGYNLGEAKRFTVPGAADGTAFTVKEAGSGKVVYKGIIKDYVGYFTDFNPAGSTKEYIVSVPGHGESVPFWVADHLMEKVSTRLAYQFFIDVRGGYTTSLLPSNVTGGGPSRDGGGHGLETVFEGLLYASNPALFDRWTKELRQYGNKVYPVVPPDDTEPDSDHGEYGERPYAEYRKMPDLIKLLLWHAEFAYNNVGYNGKAGGAYENLRDFDGTRVFGYQGQPMQSFDYQNLLDQLAATCAFYHAFLKPYLPEKTYRQYRATCLQRWEIYERQKEVRYWVNSKKWIDEGWREFNEMGNAYGQGLLRNLLMYEAERHEPNGGESARFLKYAQDCATDIIKNWNFDNEWHTWAMRNAEHITPQALALFLMLEPEKCPVGTKEKLAAWADYIKRRSNNLWQYRTHSDTEWAHRKSKEIGTVCGLGGSLFAVAQVLNDPKLREIGWSQVNNVFGLNPSGCHLGNKSAARVALNGYWAGVEQGWPYIHSFGAGELAYCRGTIDGSPTNSGFPFNPDSASLSDRPNLYATEGWCLTNRAWMTSVTFSTFGSHVVRILNKQNQPITNAKPGDVVTLELKAALNQDWTKPEDGYVLVTAGNTSATKVALTETGPNTGLFRAAYTIPDGSNLLTVSYGYLGFQKKAILTLNGANAAK
ncbi:hypothetical protein [Fibrisoma limi]|uniref:hypothetical protein n=1 Tax=Fibrisoma limi TaxID=663275 RepID=UPI001E3DEA36|nr:hypothetical protein [Fibrisoma limi]